MDQESRSEAEVFSLLQPELLSDKQLREILISRCVSRNLYELSRNELIELFRNVALPRPQREYGTHSWREKLLARKQNKSKRTISFLSSETSSTKLEPGRKLPRLSDEKPTPPQERLKPPPDLINYKRKVIRLSDSSNSRSSDNLDKIVIKKIKPKEKNESSSDEQAHNSKSAQTPEVNGKKISLAKVESTASNVVKLKRDSITIKDEKLEETKKEESSAKKKRQKIVISW